MRKNVLKYDDVMNAQRREVYAQRREFMQAVDVAETVAEMRAEIIAALVARRIPEKAYAEQWETAELEEDAKRLLNLDLPVVEWGREEGMDETGIRERIEGAADQLMAAKAANFGPELMRFVEKSLLLQTLDAVWKEHLLALDHLRQGIGLRAYGQRDPLNEYKSEAFAMFNAMLDDLKERVTALLARVEIGPEAPQAPLFQQEELAPSSLHYSDPASAAPYAGGDVLEAERPATPRPPPIRPTRRPGRTRPETPPAHAAPARSTSTATARFDPLASYPGGVPPAAIAASITARSVVPHGSRVPARNRRKIA